MKGNFVILVALRLVVLGLLTTAAAAKLRSWLGPRSFIEGNFPVARKNHGFSAAIDGKIYVFGGESLDDGNCS